MIERLFIIWYGLISFIAFIAMGNDKRKAVKGEWRTPEATLILLAYLGGFIGSILGMHIFHHKTKKWYFHFNFILACILHIIIIYFIKKYFGNLLIL